MLSITLAVHLIVLIIQSPKGHILSSLKPFNQESEADSHHDNFKCFLSTFKGLKTVKGFGCKVSFKNFQRKTNEIRELLHLSSFFFLMVR